MGITEFGSGGEAGRCSKTAGASTVGATVGAGDTVKDEAAAGTVAGAVTGREAAGTAAGAAPLALAGSTVSPSTGAKLEIVAGAGAAASMGVSAGPATGAASVDGPELPPEDCTAFWTCSCILRTRSAVAPSGVSFR